MKNILVLLLVLFLCSCEDDECYNDYHSRRHYDGEVIYVERQPYYWSNSYDDYVYEVDNRIYYYRKAIEGKMK